MQLIFEWCWGHVTIVLQISMGRFSCMYFIQRYKFSNMFTYIFCFSNFFRIGWCKSFTAQLICLIGVKTVWKRNLFLFVFINLRNCCLTTADCSCMTCLQSYLKCVFCALKCIMLLTSNYFWSCILIFILALHENCYSSAKTSIILITLAYCPCTTYYFNLWMQL